MRVKLFRGATMAEAMSCVRTQLGPEALILSSRRVGGGIEVTAGTEDDGVEELPSAIQPSPPGSVLDDMSSSGQAHRPWRPPAMAVGTRAINSDQACAIWPRHTRERDNGGIRHSRQAACLAWHGVPDSLARRLGRHPIPQGLRATFRFGAIAPPDDRRPILLAGPPGAGKTLTVARLATRMVMQGQTPLVITTDGRRAGAAEQLAAFTRLLGLELLVARGPDALAHAFARRDGETPVLVDSPGTDNPGTSGGCEIVALREAIDARLLLVLAAGMDAVEAGEIGQAFRDRGAELLVANRLDVSRRLGGILSAAASGLAFAEAGIGPGAADGLVPLTPDLLADRLMSCPESAP